MNKVHVANTRRKIKATLVKEHGGKCVDCGYVGPAFMYDFDHRDPSTKTPGILGSGNTVSLERQRVEAAKCDLTCCMCHRMRTHKQRCAGCEDCIGL